MTRTFLSTTGTGVARLRETDRWPVDEHLTDTQVHALATGPTGTDLVFAATSNGVFRSSDRGSTWRPHGLEDLDVRSLAVAASDPERVYAGVRPPGVYRSDDGGMTWTACEAFQSIRGRRLWRSPASSPFTAYVQGLAVSSTDPDLVVAGIEFGAVVRSTDGGDTWSNHRRKAIRDCHSLVWHATDGDCVYEGGAGFPRRPGARSTDGGDTWVKPGGADRSYGWAVAAHPADSDIWYVSASTGPSAAHGSTDAKAAVFRCIDGSGWIQLSGLPSDVMVYALCTDVTAPDHLWAGLADGTICHSPDRGTTWEVLGGELPVIDGAMVMLPP